MGDILNSTQNVTLFGGDNPAFSKAVTSTTDGSKERLDVNAKLEESGLTFQLQPFTPMFHKDVSGITLVNGVDTSIFSYTGDGKLDFINLAGGNSNYEVAIKIDGTEVFRATMNDLGSVLGLQNLTTSPIWVDTASKFFRFRPIEGVDFKTSFEILAKGTSATVPTIYTLISYRVTS